MNKDEFRMLWASQMDDPQVVMAGHQTRKVWWVFQGEFYWEDERLSAYQVKALLLQRRRKEERRIQSAVSLMEQENLLMEQENPETTHENDKRESIPDDVKISVCRRDKGRCAKCGSKQNLEFDHIIPLSKGGSNRAGNIQLLCEKCNRSKRDSVA